MTNLYNDKTKKKVLNKLDFHSSAEKKLEGPCVLLDMKNYNLSAGLYHHM